MPGEAPPDRIISGFLAVYQEAEVDLLRALAGAVERGAATGDLIAQAAEANRLRTRTEGIAGQLIRAVAQAVPDTLLEAVIWGGRRAIADLDGLLGPAGRDYSSPLNRNALNLLARSLSDTLTPVHAAVTRVIDDAYKAISGQASVGVLTGTTTRRDAAQRALDRYARAGIRGFTDRSGRSWELASYAEMSVRAATARAAVDAHTDRLAAEGLDLLYVSDSPQECKRCRPWEGKVLTRNGPSSPHTVVVASVTSDRPVTVQVAGSLDAARRAGLMHPNCTHSVSAYLPGATRLPTNTENPQGDRDRQKLRRLEREVRAAKRVEAAAFTAEAKAAAAADVRARQARIRDHVAESGLIRQPAREQINRAR